MRFNPWLTISIWKSQIIIEELERDMSEWAVQFNWSLYAVHHRVIQKHLHPHSLHCFGRNNKCHSTLPIVLLILSHHHHCFIINSTPTSNPLSCVWRSMPAFQVRELCILRHLKSGTRSSQTANLRIISINGNNPPASRRTINFSPGFHRRACDDQTRLIKNGDLSWYRPWHVTCC